MNNIAETLQKLRRERGLSQEELAAKLLVSRQAISKWERGEALPDLENMIAISKLYGVSIDALVGNEEVLNEEPVQAADEQTSKKEGIRIIIGGEELEDGISDEVEVELDEDLEEIELEKLEDIQLETKKKKSPSARFFYAIPYPIVVTVAYLLWGFLWDGWAVGWTLYLTIPVYYTLLDAIYKKRFSAFAYPVFVAAAYCFVGMQWGIWHPTWIAFITIPIYYCIAGPIDSALRKREMK